MPSKVFFGSPRQARLEANETLPAKLDLILNQLNLRERVKGETVAIKMHTGNNIVYSTVHPVFVRIVVQAIKDGGGKPFIADVNWDARGAELRGYSNEVVGCQVYAAAGPDEKYFYSHHHPYKNVQDWHVAGMIEDATFLVNLAHVKGHPSCGFGAAIKNLALGCMVGTTRSAIHDTTHIDPYWFPDKCPDEATRQRLIAACPFEALVDDKEHPGGLHIRFDLCNNCGRCLRVAPPGSLKIDAVNYNVFMEACAHSVAVTLSTFQPGKAVHINLATQISPVCDCYGFTSMPILPDAGVFGSDDIVAVDQAVLDMTAKTPLIEENVPTSLEIHTRLGHPFQVLHGPLKDPYKMTEYAEKVGLGSRAYELVDVLPLEKIDWAPLPYIPAR